MCASYACGTAERGVSFSSSIGKWALPHQAEGLSNQEKSGIHLHVVLLARSCLLVALRIHVCQMQSN